MAEPISWSEALRPAVHWVDRHLPTFLFKRCYSTRDIEHDVRIFFAEANGCTVRLPRRLQAPTLEVEASILNASPYLDLTAKSIHSYLVAESAPQISGIFAMYDDWDQLELRRNDTTPLQLVYWLNKFQLEIVQEVLEKRYSLRVNIAIVVESKLGRAVPWKDFRITSPIVK